MNLFFPRWGPELGLVDMKNYIYFSNQLKIRNRSFVCPSVPTISFFGAYQCKGLNGKMKFGS